jgi:hypothetical protein
MRQINHPESEAGRQCVCVQKRGKKFSVSHLWLRKHFVHRQAQPYLDGIHHLVPVGTSQVVIRHKSLQHTFVVPIAKRAARWRAGDGCGCSACHRLPFKGASKDGLPSQWPTDVRQQASAVWAEAVGQGHAAAQSWCAARVLSQRQAQAVLDLRLPVSSRWSCVGSVRCQSQTMACCQSARAASMTLAKPWSKQSSGARSDNKRCG